MTNAQRKTSEAALSSQKGASTGAAPNPQRRASEAAAPNPQRRPPEEVPNTQKKPSPSTTIAAEPHGNPSILSEELEDEFEVIDLEDL